MRKSLLPAFFVMATCALSLAQKATAFTQFATVLPDYKGAIIQYAFPLSPFSQWIPSGKVSKFDFQGSDTVQIITVKGVTELYLWDTHDICGPKAGPVGSCSFLGTMWGPLLTEAKKTPEGASYSCVSATFYGVFEDPHGAEFNVEALLSFDTFPTVDGAVWASTGGLTIVLQYN